jgi:hypothetical protein
MKSRNRLALLIKLMIMDSIGLTLIGVGVAKLQVHLDILPEGLRFAYSGWVFIVAGLALLWPTLILVIKFFRNPTLIDNKGD